MLYPVEMPGTLIETGSNWHESRSAQRTYHSFPSTGLKPTMSSPCSATICFSLRFSSSICRNRKRLWRPYLAAKLNPSTLICRTKPRGQLKRTRYLRPDDDPVTAMLFPPCY